MLQWKLPEKKSTYEKMEQNFDTHQFATRETGNSTSSSQNSGCDDHNENSSVVVQQISASAITTVATTVPLTLGTLQFFLLCISLIGAKITDKNGIYILMAVAEVFRCDTEKPYNKSHFFQRFRKKI